MSSSSFAIPAPMPDHLQAYASMSVPRYTSYPTAPNFQSTAPDAPDGMVGMYRNWLGAIDPATPISLYIHIPFCRQMCWYCGCNMKLAARYDPVSDYVAALLGEIALVEQAIGARVPVAHLHWGGGTPTALEPSDFVRIMARLRSAFKILPDAELAIESDPRTLTLDMIDVLGEQGMTRASFGVQDFTPKVQKAINRIQPPDMVAECVGALRAAGVANINFDLIYGLPYQDLADLTNTLNVSVAMAPDRIALFGYAHVPWMAKNQRMIPEQALPGSHLRAAQMALAAEFLPQMGYHAIGFDHFALPEDSMAIAARHGALHRNFQGYTTDGCTTMIGFGVTSIGRTPFGFAQNIGETGAYQRAIAKGSLPNAKLCVFQEQDRLRGHVIERILCDHKVDLAGAAETFDAPRDWFAQLLPDLRRLEADGLLNLDQNGLALTDIGRPFGRVVASIFDVYHQEKAGRHSLAI